MERIVFFMDDLKICGKNDKELYPVIVSLQREKKARLERINLSYWEEIDEAESRSNKYLAS